jgi:hypothetical protein
LSIIIEYRRSLNLVGQNGVDYQNTLPEQDKTLKDFRKGLNRDMYRISVWFFFLLSVSGKVRCGNKQCREDLGGVQQYSDRPDLREICVLKCKQLKFSFRDENGQNQILTYKKWTDVTFKILEVEPLASNIT